MANNGQGSNLGIVAAVLAIVALMLSVWRVGPVGPPGPRGEDGKVIAPIGTIIAWHANTLAISHPNDEKKRALSLKLAGDGSWMRCDGQTLSRVDYPLLFRGFSGDVNALALPNLNDADKPGFRGIEGQGDDLGGGVFFRGGTVSGIFQEATQVHVLTEIGGSQDFTSRLRGP